LRVLAGVADRGDEQARVEIARHHGVPAVATFPNAFTGIEQQAPFHFLGARRVAFVALLGQHRADILFEKLHALGVGCAHGGNRRGIQRSEHPRGGEREEDGGK